MAGVSVGDIISIATFAWKTYKACKGAGKEFRDIAQEVLSLHTVLKQVKDEATSPTSLFTEQGKAEELTSVLAGFRSALKDVDSVIRQCSSLGTDRARLRDRIKFIQADLNSARHKISIHMNTIAVLFSCSQNVAFRAIFQLLNQTSSGSATVSHPTKIPSLAHGAADENEADSQWHRSRMETKTEGSPPAGLEASRPLVQAPAADMADEGASPSMTWQNYTPTQFPEPIPTATSWNTTFDPVFAAGTMYYNQATPSAPFSSIPTTHLLRPEKSERGSKKFDIHIILKVFQIKRRGRFNWPLEVKTYFDIQSDGQNAWLAGGSELHIGENVKDWIFKRDRGKLLLEWDKVNSKDITLTPLSVSKRGQCPQKGAYYEELKDLTRRLQNLEGTRTNTSIRFE